MAPNTQIHHEYQTNFWDMCLEVYKFLVPNAETRHDQISDFARFAKFLPKQKLDMPQSMERIIKFKDKSNPLYMNSPIMLAAGGNKFAENLADFAHLGFGSVTVGSATRHEREGNPFKQRIRLLPKDRSIQNNMGLNNPGVDTLAKSIDHQLGRCKKNNMCVGLSVAQSPGLVDSTERLDDLLGTFRKAYNAAEYVEINLSSHNSGQSRTDSEVHFVEDLLKGIMNIRRSLPVRKAVYAKLSPDLNPKQYKYILDLVQNQGLNGVVLFNTFPGERGRFLKLNGGDESLKAVDREGGLGGLSGRALYANTYHGVKYVKDNYPDLSVIAVGGIDHGAKVWDLLKAGADAVQCYSVLSYRYMAIWSMLSELQRCMMSSGVSKIQELYDQDEQY
jgi:dihydroorotate dehydrogenase